MKIFLCEKEKVPKTLVKKVFGKRLFGYDGNGFHFLRLQGLIRPVGRNACDTIENVEAVRELTESRVITVKVRSVLVHDEELRACGVGVHGTSHRDYASGVLQGVLHAVGSKFALDLIAGTAHTCSCGVTALNHKARDYSVEDQTVIKAFVCKLYEVSNGDGSNFGIKFQSHGTAVFHFNNCFCHI